MASNINSFELEHLLEVYLIVKEKSRFITCLLLEKTIYIVTLVATIILGVKEGLSLDLKPLAFSIFGAVIFTMVVDVGVAVYHAFRGKIFKKKRYNSMKLALFLAGMIVSLSHLVSIYEGHKKGGCSCRASPIVSLSAFFLGLKSLQLFHGFWLSVLKEELPIAEEWWRKDKDVYARAIFSPIFLCFAADKLELTTLYHFLLQGYHHLEALLEGYEMAEDNTDHKGDKSAIANLRELVYKSFFAYRNFLRKRGIQPSKENISPLTLEFIEFVLTTASGTVHGKQVEKTKVAAYMVAVTTPVMRLTSHLCGIILRHEYSQTNPHIFKKWLEEPKCSKFVETLVKTTEDILDKLSASLTKEDLEVAEKLYHQAMTMQVEQFASQPVSQPSIVPLTRVRDLSQLTIFSNFDLTCSVVDSSAVLTELAIITSPEDLKKTLGQCLDSIILGLPGKDFNYEGLEKAIYKVSEVKKRAIERVEESGVLKGMLQDQIKKAGQDLSLHKGCREFFKQTAKFENPRINVHVISSCWCGDLIRSAFSSDLEALNVHSNELVYEEAITTGKIDKRVESPNKKLQVFKEVLQGRNGDSSEGKHLNIYVAPSGSEGNHLKVFIGGDVGDFLCLVEADIGIVLGSSRSLRRLGEYFGVSFVPLLDGAVKNQMGLDEWKSRCGILYTVESWAEIQAFILGL